MQQFLKRITRFITNDIWTVRDDAYSTKRRRWLNRQIKVVIFTIQSSRNHQVTVRSAALTFYTVMSIVPIIALVFGIAKGFSLETHLETYLLQEFGQYADFVRGVSDFAYGVLQRTKGGIVASVGFLVLFWAVVRVFSNVENAFNNIWEVKRQRGFARKFSDYMALIFVVPILWIISGSGTLYLAEAIRYYSYYLGISQVVEWLFQLVPFVAMWLLLTFVYYVMPNTNVKLKSCIKAGVVAGTVFQAFQFFYVTFQSGMSSYNAIYGSFAAIPLFLVWMQMSWQILLLGAELSFAFQNTEKYEFEREVSQISYDLRKRVTILVMHKVVRNFMDNKGAISSEGIATELNLPVRIVREVVFDLERAGLVLLVRHEEQKSNYYAPAQDVHTLRVYDVIRSVERVGLNTFRMEECPELHRITHILADFQGVLEEAPDNKLLMDIKEESCRKVL